jgi:hypothetical protein
MPVVGLVLSEKNGPCLLRARTGQSQEGHVIVRMKCCDADIVLVTVRQLVCQSPTNICFMSMYLACQPISYT